MSTANCTMTGTDRGGLHSRSTRIWGALSVAAVLGMADLWLTIYFMHTTGMNEMNPIARMLVGIGPMALVCFKLLCILLNGTILVCLRARPTAELGAWASVLLMAALTLHWHEYVHGSHEVASLDPTVLAADPTFVKIGG